MEKIKIYYDRAGNTLTVWFGDSSEEYICEETGDEVILMKDKSGNVDMLLDGINFFNKDIMSAYKHFFVIAV